MDFSEYFLNLFPQWIKKAIIYFAKFLAWLDVIAFFGGLAAALIGWFVFKSEVALGIGLASFVTAIFAIIPFLLMYTSADRIDFKDQLGELLEKEKKAAESRLKLSQSEQAKLAKLKERQKKIAALEAKNGHKQTGTLGCVVSILAWSFIFVFFGYGTNLLILMLAGWALIFSLIVVSIMYMMSGYADTNKVGPQVAEPTELGTFRQAPTLPTRNDRAPNHLAPQRSVQPGPQISDALTDSYSNDDMQY